MMRDDNFHPVPKPKNTKKKKPTNGYKDKAGRMCYYCGTYGAERHEVFQGANRTLSIEYGFQVDLCPECHRKWHEQKDEEWISRKKQWQEHYQKQFETKLTDDGMKPKDARDIWMRIFFKNYTDEVM